LTGFFSAVVPRLARLRVHEVDDLGLWRLGRGGGDVLAFHLLLDGLEYALADSVVVVLRPELLHRGLLDELPRQGQLGVLEGDLGQGHLVRALELARVVELLHDQHVAHWAEQHQVLLASGGILAQGRTAGVGQRRD
jgi:hypothetical protein